MKSPRKKDPNLKFLLARLGPETLETLCKAALTDRRWFALTTKGGVRHDTPQFTDNDVFVFGRETSGLPAEVMAEFPPAQRLRLPMLPGQRSLNLSNAVAVTVFEAWRQLGFGGAS